MSPETKGTRVKQPIDPYEGPHYTKLVKDNMGKKTVDHIYNLNRGIKDEYVNLIVHGVVS
jgi:hypothetical protein